MPLRRNKMVEGKEDRVIRNRAGRRVDTGKGNRDRTMRQANREGGK